LATIHVTLAVVQARTSNGLALPVPDSVPIGKDTVSSTGTSGLCTLTGQPGQVWMITSLDGSVWLNFGPGTPVAAAEDGWLLVAGHSIDLAVTAANEKLAIKDAA
jgi:hypothetical protein